MKIDSINPKDMPRPRGYSQAVSVSGNRRTVYIGGQNAIDENGNVVGKGDLRSQTEQILSNIEKILRDANGTFANVVKFNVYIQQGRNPTDGFQAFREKWKDNDSFPTVTAVFVAGLGNPDWLVEIEAVAEIPAKE
jgi:enamine deaminase RidA (YjgF/YER057c/UK114 family)